jgi:pyrimidine operon attenuation protein/uracil phosphoribosyltransferase
MKLEDLMTLWAADSEIRQENLVAETTRIPRLHATYYKILIEERTLLMSLKARQEELALVLEGYFGKTLTQEELEKWGLTMTDKRFMKADIGKHVEVHPMMMALKLKIGVQNEKVKFVEDVIKMIHSMNFTIKNCIDMKKFNAGAY